MGIGQHTPAEVYSLLHRVLGETAAITKLRRFDVRVVLALADKAGEATNSELYALLTDTRGSMVRRSLVILDRRGYIERRSMDGGEARRGIRHVVTLTPAGQRVVDVFRTKTQAVLT